MNIVAQKMSKMTKNRIKLLRAGHGEILLQLDPGADGNPFPAQGLGQADASGDKLLPGRRHPVPICRRTVLGVP